MNKIQRSVGRNGVNIVSDVILIQQLLNKQRILGATKPLKEDGKAGSLTIDRIEAFQKNNLKMFRPDGRVDPDGKTFHALTSSAATSPVKKTNNNLQFSNNGLTLLKAIEKLRTKPYDDQTGDDITAWCEGQRLVMVT